MNKKRNSVNYLRLEKIINQYYIAADDIAVLACCNIKYARQIAKDVKAEMEKEGVPIISSRPLRVPCERVLKALRMNSTDIRKQAESIRKSGVTA